ncbi:MAG: hypothetical protein OHK0039_34980 [Bacteroidia bacterium]
MKRLSLLFFAVCSCVSLLAGGEAATYFEIFVPPNNDAVRRHVAIIITAIYDSTTFELIDDGMDGDTDDSVTGTLMSGQSYIRYIRDGAVNDDANEPGRSGAKQDGDFFIIRSSKLVVASQSCDSDWQHDWVPATNKTSRGTRFIIYAPQTSYSKRDLDVFAYEDSTVVTIRKVSTFNITTTGYTQVNMNSAQIVAQRMIRPGEDLIFYHTNGRDIMDPGATYVVEANKAVTVQYGALFGNARDGGGYVPADNGSTSGELFYFAVPFQSAREQEVRIVSWDDANDVTLDYYSGGSWVNIQTWRLDELQPGDWVSYNGNKSAVFRVTCTPGKKVSVFEVNWLETGSPGTSDIASTISARNGTSAGREFLVYMAPPGRENNVRNPFTGQKYDFASHVYLFSRDTAQVRVRDANTDGAVIDRSYTIIPGSYVDCFLNRAQWNSIYNGNGTPSGTDRPYLHIESDRPISVFSTNFNDNWMAYFGTSQTQDFAVVAVEGDNAGEPGDTVTVRAGVVINGDDPVTNVQVEVIVGNGATVIESRLVDNDSLNITGELFPNENTGETRVVFDSVPDLSPDNDYYTETDVRLNSNYGNGDPIPSNTVVTVETVLTGEIDGSQQQASTSGGITNQTANRPPPMFFRLIGGNIGTDKYENLGASFGDYNNDGLQDLFVAGYNSGQPNLLYRNNGNRSFTKIAQGHPAIDLGASVSGTWGDYDNDGDPDLFVARAGSPSQLFVNNGGTFMPVNKGAIAEYTGSCFNAAWIDYDRDGHLDLLLTDYISNRPNALFHNAGDGTFTRVNSDLVLPGAYYSLGATWCDYDDDGYPDLFVPNDNGQNNSLFRNNGNGTFASLDEGDIVRDSSSSVGGSWGDYDNDGDFDLFVTTTGRARNLLYRNDGGGVMTRVTDGAIANDIGDSQGSVWGDFDNDGDLDLFVTNSGDQSHFLYFNQGDGSFSRDTDEPITEMESFVLGVAAADIENDGDLDLFIASHFDKPNYLYSNNGNSNTWIEIKLVGTRSNRSAIGARVRVKAQIRGSEVWQVRQIEAQSGGGPGAQSSLIAHFGLGEATTIDSIIVEWPNGYRQFETDVAVNQLYAIVEEAGTLVSGRVYYDADSSCSLGADERGIPNMRVRIQPGNLVVMTDSAGYYAAHLNDGTYTFSQAPNDFWAQVCPGGTGSHTVQVVAGGGHPILSYEKASDLADCSWGCTRTISTNTSSGLTVAAGEMVCIAAGVTVSGNVTMNGGTLMVCGTLSPSNFNLNGNDAKLLIVSSTGRLTSNNFNLSNNGFTFINHGTNTSIGSPNIGTHVENHGTLLLNGLNINSGGDLLNTGLLQISGNVNNNATLVNYGQMAIAGTVNNNGSGTWNNHCRLTIAGNFTQNGTWLHEGYMTVSGSSTFNGGSNNTLSAGARLITTNLTLNADLNGPQRPQVGIEVLGTTTVNSGAVIFGYIDLCDANGIETMHGSLATFSTMDCTGAIGTEACNNGARTLAYTDYDFGNRGVCPSPDLRVSLGTTGLRRGFSNTFVLQVANDGPVDATDVTVDLTLSNWLSLQTADPVPADTLLYPNQYTLRWVLPYIESMRTQTLSVVDSVLAEVPFGEYLTTRLSAWAAQADCDSASNAATSTDEVVGSFDPNDKLVYPIGYGPEHYILGTDTLYYKVRFQNVGNYYASRVVIYDTLSAHLDPATFVPGPMSHTGSVVLTEGGVLIWTFDNIYLPDSGTNEALSHGFVQFKILPDPDLPDGTAITNGAAIVFDYNEPIFTNHTLNTVVNRLDYEADYLLIFHAYPNPVRDLSRGMVYDLEEGWIPVPLAEVVLFDAMGRLADRLDAAGSSEVLLRRSAYRPGVYFVRATDIHGNSYTGHILVAD